MQNAHAVGVNEFKGFLETEDARLEYVLDCMSKNPNGRCMGAVVDKFALHLAFTVGVKEKMPATNTVMSYFCHAKNRLLDLIPTSQSALEDRLREMARIVEKHLMKKEAGSVTKHAAACTKQDLSLLARYLYVNATSPTDYQGAALVSMLWYVFGRASDCSLVQKASVSVCSSKNFFVRLVRVKTTDQQGLALYSDNAITTCSILATAVSFAMQSAPCLPLLEHARPTPMKLGIETLKTLSLTKLLLQAEQPLPTPVAAATTSKSKKTVTTENPPAPSEIHNHINILLRCIAKLAGVVAPLSYFFAGEAHSTPTARQA